ncbi:MAG: hypothetical protein MUC62_04060 [Candidatus Thermoplasmatota archaeon]|jgi:hypothetical protein|nr:hypothetical protein [Candidatus Thermoplasmatota archaeon]
MEKKPVPKAIRAPPMQEDSIRIMEVSEVISLFTGKGLGKERSKVTEECDIELYA